jgi:hypothetical protein
LWHFFLPFALRVSLLAVLMKLVTDTQFQQDIETKKTPLCALSSGAKSKGLPRLIHFTLSYLVIFVSCNDGKKYFFRHRWDPL